jgi:hypothetical protein
MLRKALRKHGVISWDWNVWPALLDLHLSRGSFCTMEFKRSRSPTIFAPCPYQRYGPNGWTAVWRFAASAMSRQWHYY